MVVGGVFVYVSEPGSACKKAIVQSFIMQFFLGPR